MKLALISFTAHGRELGEKLTESLRRNGHECTYCTSLKTSLNRWTMEQFQTKDGIIFIGAAGIAVRGIASCLKDKEKDPAVVVLDDSGRFSISLLSGHMGGANELAKEAAGIVGAMAVITTATDIHKKFAVDVFAKKRGLVISDRVLAKEISADLLDEKPVGCYSDFLMSGEMADGLIRDGNCRRNFRITISSKQEPGTLRLIPKLVVLGIGCRKAVEKAVIEKSVEEVLNRYEIAAESIKAVASIDLKKEEEGLKAYARQLGVNFYTYSSEQLAKTEGEFLESSFVEKVTGVGNVCERAALTCINEMGGGTLLIAKQVICGVTVAAAVLEWKVIW